MFKRYLKGDPIPWLTDGVNPAVSYFTKSEILKVNDLEEVYSELLTSGLTDYFKKNTVKGILGDIKHFDLFYRGTVWFFLLAVESGYTTTTEFVSTTADYICGKSQLDNGGFRFNCKSTDAIGCRTGNMVNALLSAGIHDSRTKDGISWIINNQRNDGGWLHCPVSGFCDVMKLVFLNKAGNSLKHEKDDRIQSCPVASYSCLKAIVEAKDNNLKESIFKAKEYFLNNKYFKENNNKLLCGNRTEFSKLGYPVMSQYDYLSGMILVSKIENQNKSIENELFNTLIKKQNNDGTWNFENTTNGMIKDKKREKQMGNTKHFKINK